MSWTTTGRNLPRDWAARRSQVLAEESDCQLAYPDEWTTRHGVRRCTRVSTEVDHINDPLDHSRPNLRGVCASCHARRTQAQAAAAQQGVAGRARYPTTRAPGLL